MTYYVADRQPLCNYKYYCRHPSTLPQFQSTPELPQIYTSIENQNIGIVAIPCQNRWCQMSSETKIHQKWSKTVPLPNANPDPHALQFQTNNTESDTLQTLLKISEPLILPKTFADIPQYGELECRDSQKAGVPLVNSSAAKCQVGSKSSRTGPTMDHFTIQNWTKIRSKS